MDHDKLIKCAFVYDFDGTLAEGDCVQWGVMPSLNIVPEEFWNEVKERCRNDDGDEILAYLGLLLEKVNSQNSNVLDEQELINFGESIKLFHGVDTWFDRMNDYGKKHDIFICHYIISSGLEAMIRGTSIGDKFRQIYACKYHYK
jgi:hypothetical protein